MRRWLRSLAVGLSLVALACTPATPTPVPSGGSTQAGPDLAENQKLAIAFPFASPNLDPHLQTSGTVRRFDMFETLILLDETGKAEPMLATEWKSIDATTWRFTLRKDSKFHDGSPLTADDVAFSWKRVSSGGIRSPIPGSIPTVADITVVDPSTVDVKTKAPDPLLVKRLYYLAILPKAYLERVGDQEFALKPIGSGPFQLKEFRPDDRVVVTRWDGHAWRKPKLTEITVRAVPDGNARVQGLKLGEVDVASQISIDAVDGLKKDGFAVYLTPPVAVSGGFLDTVGGNGVEPGPLVEKKVRQAINYAIDRETLARTVFAGVQQPAGLIILPGSFGHNPDVKPYTFDRARARQLLAEAGYPNGFKTVLGTWISSPQSQPTALYVQSQLKEVGIDAEIQILDPVTFGQAIYKQKAIPSIFLGGTGTAPYFDADLFLTWFWSGNRSFGKRFDSREFDQAYEASLTELDVTKREALLKRAVQIAQDEAPWFSLTTTQGVTAVSKNLVGSFGRSDFWPVFDQVYRTK